MTQQRRLAFQMRVSNGKYTVYLIRALGRPVPSAVQRAVFTSPNQSRAQLICDSLNNGLWDQIYLAAEAAVNAQQAAQAAARVERRPV